MPRVEAALLATKIARGRLASPLTAREVYRNEWTGLTEPRVEQGALDSLEDLGWIRAEAVKARDGGGPPCGSASTRGSWRAGMTNRAALRRIVRGSHHRETVARGFILPSTTARIA